MDDCMVSYSLLRSVVKLSVCCTNCLALALNLRMVKKKRKPIISDTSTENDRPNHNHNESTVPVHSKSNKNKKKNVVEPATKTEPLKHSDKSMKSADDIDIDHVDDFIFKRQPVNTTQSINNQENMTSTQLHQNINHNATISNIAVPTKKKVLFNSTNTLFTLSSPLEPRKPFNTVNTVTLSLANMNNNMSTTNKSNINQLYTQYIKKSNITSNDIVKSTVIPTNSTIVTK